ncbi:MAG: tRNA guanosine(34) transglycosylase Tgt [Coriobacteriia bacterium]|nr:tRNA guanosine(34) transglycosylase Tgt [Coriobacteriia bacterium]
MSTSAGQFSLLAKDPGTRARCGLLRTAHGEVSTPAFMPVGTQATVKALTPRLLEEARAQMILGNAYHLAVRPGTHVIGLAGGLHRFCGWRGPILTDSGGFQVFSLARLRRVSDGGVEFQSPLDGVTRFITPSTAIEIQNVLGADIIMAFDECVGYPCEREAATEAVQRTLRWAQECRRAHQRPGQALFGIVQGSMYPELRRDCARELVAIGFDGYAIGGVSVGESRELMYHTVTATEPLLPQEKPRYLMGVGTPLDLVTFVGMGIDLFDCVMPTRNARGACAFTSEGKVRLRNARYRDDLRPLDSRCSCYTCTQFSRAYLRHLFVCREMLGGILLSLHNVTFYTALMQSCREAIRAGCFSEFAREFVRAQGSSLSEQRETDDSDGYVGDGRSALRR